MDDGITPIPILEPYIAIGSGSDFAISAMSMGKTAKEAIEEAIKHDIYTGGTVDVVQCSLFFASPKSKRKDLLSDAKKRGKKR